MRLFDKQWPQDFNKRFFIGMHMPDLDQHSGLRGILSRVDPDDMVRRLSATGCDTLYCYMSCHMGNCYYPTQVRYGRIHSALGGRDLFGEVAAACRKHRIALVAVYEFMNLQFKIKHDQAPADWNHYRRDSEGRLVSAGLCWNGGYGDFVIAQIREVAAAYPVAGFYLDILDYPGRELCPACVARFRRELGREPPTLAADVKSPLFKEYKLWTFREAARYLARLRQNIHEFIPEATLLHNYHYLISEDLYEARAAVDYIGTDPTIGYGGRQGLTRAYNAAVVFRALSEGKTAPFDILYDNIVMGLLEVMPLEPYLAIASSAPAHGGWPCLCSMWAKDGTLNPATLGLAKEVFTHMERVKDWVGRWKSLKTAGVYLAQETEFLYANPGDLQDRVGARSHLHSFFGALMMLEHEHILTDVLTRRQLGRLADYALIVLPNAVCLSAMEVEALRDYVRNGGTLMASYETSLADEWGNRQSNFRLADVFGVDFTGAAVDPYIALQMNIRNPGDFPFEPWENPCVTVNESGLTVKCHPGAREIAALHDRYRPSADPRELPAIRNAFMMENPLGPAIVERRCGRGRCLYFAAEIFKAYAFRQIPEIRKLAARWLIAPELARSPLALDAPGCVKISAFERPAEARWIVHLVNIQSIPGDSWLDAGCIPITDYLIPVSNLRLTIRPGPRTVASIKAIVAGIPLTWQKADDGYVAALPQLHAHEVIVIEFAASWPATPERYNERDPLAMIRCPRDAKEADYRKRESPADTWDGLGEGQA